MQTLLIVGIIGTIVSGTLLLISTLGKKPIRSLMFASLNGKYANQCHRNIRELLPKCKSLVRLRFRLLVGNKRYDDYMNQA